MTDAAESSRTPSARFVAAVQGRYAIDGTLGEGGMGTVYLGRDIRYGRRVAIKFLAPHAASLLGALRFQREVRITACLQHPNILPLLDSGEEDAVAWHVAPYVEGGSLRARLADGPLPPAEAVRLVAELAGALDYAHDRGVIHCDIKPENILLSGGHAVLADFGVARALTEVGGRILDGGRWVAGSPPYMSPEQACGDPVVDGRSDVYSLACVLYEMLTGVQAFAGPIGPRFRQPLPWRDWESCPIPTPLAGPIARALANDPAARYATAGEFARALGAPVVASGRETARGLGARVAAAARRVVAVGVVGLLR